jgi:ClpP class serine protease
MPTVPAMSQLAALLTRPWAMHRTELLAFVQAARDWAMEDDDVVDATADGKQPSGLSTIVGGVAVVPIQGMMLDSPPAWLKRYVSRFADSRAIAKEVARLAADPAVREIRLDINSPGGHVGGTEELGNAVAAARAAKPVNAVTDGMCCSAAYWVAAQAGSIRAMSRATEIGSIGVYTVVADVSRMYQAEGIDMHLVSSGGVKGAGAAGTPVTPALLAAEQKIIDGLAGHFRTAVASGRGRDLSAFATGETWLADEAALLGLIDHSPAHPEGAPMDLATLHKLVADHPANASTITQMAADGKDESAIRATITEAARTAELADLQAKLASAEADLKAQAEAHAKALADKDAALAAKDAELAQQTELAKHAGAHGQDPGGTVAATGKSRREMSRTERAAYVQKHGLPAYQALPF